MNNDPRRNNEGYKDMTAYAALNTVTKDEQVFQNKLSKLILCLKLMIELSGFELVGRIHLKHRKSGKEFK